LCKLSYLACRCIDNYQFTLVLADFTILVGIVAADYAGLLQCMQQDCIKSPGRGRGLEFCTDKTRILHQGFGFYGQAGDAFCSLSQIEETVTGKNA